MTSHTDAQIRAAAAAATARQEIAKKITTLTAQAENAGISVELVRELGPSVPILGVCLGHQAIGVAYGAEVVRVPPVHGKAWPIHHASTGAFDGLPSPIVAARYHSLAIARDSLPPELEVTAWSEDGVVMGVRHRSVPSARSRAVTDPSSMPSSTWSPASATGVKGAPPSSVGAMRTCSIVPRSFSRTTDSAVDTTAVIIEM